MRYRQIHQARKHFRQIFKCRGVALVSDKLDAGITDIIRYQYRINNANITHIALIVDLRRFTGVLANGSINYIAQGLKRLYKRYLNEL